MTDLRETMEKWLRHGSGPLARQLRRTGTSATATYAAYVGGTSGSALGVLVRRFFDLGDTVMEWTMLDGIKARAERDAASTPPAA